MCQAEDYERRITAPRREKKLLELEEKMKFVRGFKGEGHAVGGTRGGTSTLLATNTGGHVTSATVSPDDSPMIEQDQSHEEDIASGDRGVEIRLALKLPERTVKKHFYTKDKIRVCPISV